MRDARVELAVMTRDVDNAQRTYDAALARSLTQQGRSARASSTNSRCSRRRWSRSSRRAQVGLIAGLSVLVGVLLAAGVVFLLEMLDRRVRSRGDLESRLAVPRSGACRSGSPPAAGCCRRSIPARAPAALPHPW